jgi:hypothetical protein
VSRVRIEFRDFLEVDFTILFYWPLRSFSRDGSGRQSGSRSKENERGGEVSAGVHVFS